MSEKTPKEWIEELRDPRTGELMSTAERWQTGPSAKMLDYWDYDAQASLTCPICAWSGRGEGLEDTFKEVMDVKCPQCDHMLLVITYPTIEQTRAAAAAGNEIAQQELRHLECPQGRAQKPSAFDAEQVSAAAPGSTEVPCGTGNPDQADVGGS